MSLELKFWDRSLINDLRRFHENLKYVGYKDIESPVDAANASLIPPIKNKDFEFTQMAKRASGVWVPALRPHRGVIGGWVSYRFVMTMLRGPFTVRYGTRILGEDPERPPEPEFEVNMMEALIGWKAMSIEDGALRSASQRTEWKPDEALVAQCGNGGACQSPVASCSCGIYGGDGRQQADEYIGHGTDQVANRFLATISGWGRYVRHLGGWRAQYAYPKAFYLRTDQEKFVPMLRQFHVPIFVETPFQVYSPEEDGYEHWDPEANGYSGANPISAAPETGSSDEDDDD